MCMPCRYCSQVSIDQQINTSSKFHHGQESRPRTFFNFFVPHIATTFFIIIPSDSIFHYYTERQQFSLLYRAAAFFIIMRSGNIFIFWSLTMIFVFQKSEPTGTMVTPKVFIHNNFSFNFCNFDLI